MRGIGRGVALVASLLRISLVAAVAIMLAAIAIQVVMRYVFGRTPSWSEEVAVLMFAWAAMGGLALGVHEGFHVRLDFLLKQVSGAARRWYERGIEGVVAAFGAYLAWSGLRFLEITGGSVSAAIGYPIEILHGFAPITGALIFLFAFHRVLSAPATQAQADLQP
jgi:TRAP-type C4-dicarboxylate transport system permease small subunit